MFVRIVSASFILSVRGSADELDSVKSELEGVHIEAVESHSW